jgi:hypothetical protein
MYWNGKRAQSKIDADAGIHQIFMNAINQPCSPDVQKRDEADSPSARQKSPK